MMVILRCSASIGAMPSIVSLSRDPIPRNLDPSSQITENQIKSSPPICPTPPRNNSTTSTHDAINKRLKQRHNINHCRVPTATSLSTLLLSSRQIYAKRAVLRGDIGVATTIVLGQN